MGKTSIEKNTIRDAGSTTLYAAYTVDMVYIVNMAYTDDMVYTFNMAGVNKKILAWKNPTPDLRSHAS